MPDHTSDHTLAYVCIHVFEDTRPVLLVSRQEGDWCFLCGGEHEQKAENYRVVGRGHILARDAALHQLTDLAPNWEAERQSVLGPWIRRPTPPEE